MHRTNSTIKEILNKERNGAQYDASEGTFLQPFIQAINIKKLARSEKQAVKDLAEHLSSLRDAAETANANLNPIFESSNTPEQTTLTAVFERAIESCIVKQTGKTKSSSMLNEIILHTDPEVLKLLSDHTLNNAKDHTKHKKIIDAVLGTEKTSGIGIFRKKTPSSSNVELPSLNKDTIYLFTHSIDGFAIMRDKDNKELKTLLSSIDHKKLMGSSKAAVKELGEAISAIIDPKPTGTINPLFIEEFGPPKDDGNKTLLIDLFNQAIKDSTEKQKDQATNTSSMLKHIIKGTDVRLLALLDQDSLKEAKEFIGKGKGLKEKIDLAASIRADSSPLFTRK